MNRLRKSARVIAFVAFCVALTAIAWRAVPPSRGAAPAFALVSPPSERALQVQARSVAKHEVVARLLGGELSLLEAAAWFRYLNDSPPGEHPGFRPAFPGASDGEKACRQVIHWADATVARERGEAEARSATARSEAELDALLAEGPVELPW